MELEQQSTHAMHQNRKYEDKISIIEKDLEDNIALVAKLQEGLSQQIDNNEKINIKLINANAYNEKYVG